MLLQMIRQMIVLLAIGLSASVTANSEQPSITQHEQLQVINQVKDVIARHYYDKAGAEKMIAALAKLTQHKNAYYRQQAKNKAPVELYRLVDDIEQSLLAASDDGYLSFTVKEGFSLLTHKSSNIIQQTSADDAVISANIDQDGVGYLQLNHMSSLSQMQPAIDNAFIQLQSSCTLIIDLADIDNGDVRSALYLLSYLLPQETSFGLLVNNNNEQQLALTTQAITGNAIAVDIPVYVLTSPFMQASAELLVKALSMRSNTLLIGRETMGVAVWQQNFAINDDMTLKLPVASYVSNQQNSSWAGQGIAPDIDVDYPESLAKAKQLATNACHLASANR